MRTTAVGNGPGGDRARRRRGLGRQPARRHRLPDRSRDRRRAQAERRTARARSSRATARCGSPGRGSSTSPRSTSPRARSGGRSRPAARSRRWRATRAASRSRRAPRRRATSAARSGSSPTTTSTRSTRGGAGRVSSWHVLSLTNDGLVTLRAHAGARRGDDRSRSGGRAARRAGRRPHVHVPASARGAVLDRRSRPPGRLPRDVRAPVPRRDRPRRVRRPDPRRGSAARARRCDLSSGIVVDDAARTITFRLSEPDPDFLYKLALRSDRSFPPARPRSAPARARCPRPARTGSCATCPAARPCSCGIRHFRPWSAAAQPAGFPDRITLRLGLDPARQAAEISAGTADVMLEQPAARGARASRPTRAAATPLVGAPAVRGHVPQHPRGAVRSRRGAPRARARRRSRGRSSSSSGGSNVARPTCQILPPGFPGHQPFCPYTARPNAAGVWQAPDLATRAKPDRALRHVGDGGRRSDDPERPGEARRSAVTSSAC